MILTPVSHFPGLHQLLIGDKWSNGSQGNKECSYLCYNKTLANAHIIPKRTEKSYFPVLVVTSMQCLEYKGGMLGSERKVKKG